MTLIEKNREYAFALRVRHTHWWGTYRPLFLYRPSPQWLAQLREQYPNETVELLYRSPAQFTYLRLLEQHSAIQIYQLGDSSSYPDTRRL